MFWNTATMTIEQHNARAASQRITATKEKQAFFFLLLLLYLLYL